MLFIDRCRGCPYQGRAIGPRGNLASPIVLVGEAPGTMEIIEGRPFVGPAGGVLSKALAEARIDEADVFITNAVACQPRPVRPRVKAIDACRPRLVGDIEAARRDVVVVTLGVTAFRAVTGQREFRMRDVRGRPIQSTAGRVIPTLHPAYVLRHGLNGLEYRMLVEDLRQAWRLAIGPGD